MLAVREKCCGNNVLRARGTRYQFTAPFVVDDARFRTRLPGFEPTPHATAIAATVAWFRMAVVA